MDEEIREDIVLTPKERSELSPKARRYIAALEEKVEEQQNTLRTTGDELRRKSFSYWNRTKY
jgi:hypothetical protein